MQQHVWKSLSSGQQRAVIERPATKIAPQLRAEVARIFERVRGEGDAALLALTRELDGVELASIAASEEDFARAESQLTDRDKAAIQAAAANIEAFHRAQLPSALSVETAPGVRCERVTRPIQRVGLYVPAGSAPLPSTALMLAIPARLAGCPTRILCSPPQESGDIDPAVLYAARIGGVSTVFKLGGAQAIAAMAYGTQSVPKVDKVYGPGNAWVTAAKALAAEDPGGAAQDLPAGPSEVMVIADRSADPTFVAADLLAQAEHGPDSQVMLVCIEAATAAAVLEALASQQQHLPRRDVVHQALRHSSVILVDDMETALEVANRYAPEHLILQVERPRRWLDGVQAAGSVFIGPWAPETIGDYCSGTNHVLPTYGFARAYSSLGVADFLRSMTVQELTPAGLRAVGPTAEILATLEGLEAHAEAVRLRLARLDEGDGA